MTQISYITLILLLFTGVSFSQDECFNDLDPMELLFARHDDDRLVRLACAKALERDAEGAFYLGVILSEPENPYYYPEVGHIWLTLADKFGHKIARSYISTVFPSINKEEQNATNHFVERCLSSDFSDCGPGNKNIRHYSLGWPPQTAFYCQKHINQ